jgi:uncharacterized protein (TIGR03437 family)
MQFLRIFLFLAMVACVLPAQDPPAIDPRGVLNAFTKTAALASVGRGGILEIDGQNLGPDAGVTASGLPLPTKLGNPPIQVLIQGKAVPLFSATPNRILAQIPWNATVGAAQAVVDRGGIQSAAVNFTIAAAVPAIQTANGSGYGVAGSLDGQTLSLSASGLGPSNKTVAAGAVGTDNPPIVPTAALAAYIGGIGANVTAKLSTQRVGEFDVQIDVPAGARAGDLIALSANGTFANFTVFQGLAAPDVQFIPLPSGTPQLVTLTNADLNGNYLIAVANSDARGCYQAFLFDVLNKTMSKASDCLTGGTAAGPMVTLTNSNVFGSLAGPSTAMIFNPALSAPLNVNLPADATSLVVSGATLAALTPGPPQQRFPIDPQTGGLGTPVTIAPAAPSPVANLDVDGLTSLLTASTTLPQTHFGVIVGDNLDQATRAEFVVVDQTGNVVTTTSFPDGWLPLIAPVATGAARPALREPNFYDATGRVIYALARTSDNSQHGFVSFPIDGTAPTTIPFPDGVFAAACAPAIPLVSLTLSRTLALVAGGSNDISVQTPCPGSGFVQLDLASQGLSFIPLPSQGEFDVTAGANGNVNSYVYGLNADTLNGAASDSLFVLDGANGSAFRLGAPAGITSFQGLQQVASMNLLVGLATRRNAGDAGLVVFDLQNQAVRLLPIPSGFASVTIVGIYATTRKVVARAAKPGNDGAQLLIYDLASGAATVVPNPPGVTLYGQAGAAATAPQILIANVKANTVAAIGMDQNARQPGLLVVRIP